MYMERYVHMYIYEIFADELEANSMPLMPHIEERCPCTKCMYIYVYIYLYICICM